MISFLSKFLKKLFKEKTSDELLATRIARKMEGMSTTSKMLIEGFLKAINNNKLSFEARKAQFTSYGFIGFYSVTYEFDNLKVIIERDTNQYQHDPLKDVTVMVYNKDLKGVENFSEYFTKELEDLIRNVIESVYENRQKKIQKDKLNFLTHKE